MTIAAFSLVYMAVRVMPGGPTVSVPAVSVSLWKVGASWSRQDMPHFKVDAPGSLPRASGAR